MRFLLCYSANRIQVHENEFHSVIAAASSDTSGEVTISVWAQQKRRGSSDSPNTGALSLSDIFRVIIQLATLMAAAAFIVQNTYVVSFLNHHNNSKLTYAEPPYLDVEL